MDFVVHCRTKVIARNLLVAWSGRLGRLEEVGGLERAEIRNRSNKDPPDRLDASSHPWISCALTHDGLFRKEEKSRPRRSGNLLQHRRAGVLGYPSRIHGC